jgi:hypothetical protein
MFDLKAHLFARSAIGFELVGDHDARRSCRLLEKLAHEPLRGSSISPALDENVENEAILIDSAPKPGLPASDRDHNLIHAPLVATSGRAGECDWNMAGRISRPNDEHFRG